MNVNDPDLSGNASVVAATAPSGPGPTAVPDNEAFGKPDRGTQAGTRPTLDKRPAAGGRMLAIAALLLAILALLASVYAWQRSERVVREAARHWQEAETRVAQLEQQTKLAQDQARDLIGRSAVQESKLGEMTEQQSQLERLYKNFVADSLDSVLADAEVSVSIASQQLQVAGNVQAALTALQDAENSLKRADPQSIASLQRLLARDVDRLRAVPQTDIAGLSLRIDSIMGSLDQFPMLSGGSAPGKPAAGDEAPVAAAEPTSAMDRLAASGLRGWNSLKNELLLLIRVNKVDNPEAVMLAPEQQYFVRENLRLSLLSARLALLARNDTVLHSDLTHATEWLNRYYDVQNKGIANALASLKQIQDARIAVDMPSLSETLAAVRAQRASRETTR